MGAENPLVTIIVRTKDRPKLLRRALQSIAAQTYRPIKVVLVNDGGCDLDVEEIKGILGSISLNYVRLAENRGRAYAANTGVENARGLCVGFLDDDDVYYPSAVESLMNAASHNAPSVVYGKVMCKEYRDSDRVDAVNGRMLGVHFDSGRLIFENFIPINAFIAPLHCFHDIGPFDEGFEIYEDWDYLIRLTETYEVRFVDALVAEYSIHGSATITGKGGVPLQNYYRERLLDKYLGKAKAKDFIAYVQSVVDRVVLEKDEEMARLREAIGHLEGTIKLRDEEIAGLAVEIRTVTELLEEVPHTPMMGYLKPHNVLLTLAFFSAANIFFLLGKKRLFGTLIVVYGLVGGLTGNPLARGVGPIYGKVIAQRVLSIEHRDPGKKWAGINNLALGNFLAALGVKVFNGVHYYPDLAMWETLDPEGVYAQVYNRYGYVKAQVTHDETRFVLNQGDVFTVLLNVNDLKKTGVKYLLSEGKIIGFDGAIREIDRIESDNLYVYEVET